MAAFISEAIQVNVVRSFIQAYKGTSLILYYRWWYSKYSKYSKLSSKHFKWQGVGGILELALGYLPAVYKSIRQAGGLCIADEVQSGFARTGCHFWGFEAHGIVPDIVTVAKVTNYSADPVLTWQRRGFRVRSAAAVASTSLPALRNRCVGVKRWQNPNIGVEAAVSKHWGEKKTKPKHWGFPDYYPFILLVINSLWTRATGHVSLAVQGEDTILLTLSLSLRWKK